MDKLEKSILDELGNVAKVQKDQADKMTDAISGVRTGLDSLSKINKVNNLDLEDLLTKATNMLGDDELDFETDTEFTSQLLQIDQTQKEEIQKEVEQYQIKTLEYIEIGSDWEDYRRNISEYATENGIDLLSDPFEDMLSTEQRNHIIDKLKEDYTLKEAHCDKYDYLLAGFSGIVTGFIDIFFVGSSIIGEKGKLSILSDKQAEKLVTKFSDFIISQDKKNGVTVGMSHDKATSTLQNRVQYLEKRFKVSYDARYKSDLENGSGLKMSPKNHHTISLAHSPGLEGLFFSLLDQFTNSGTYLSNGTFKRSKNKSNSKIELKGRTFVEKIFFGFVNWIGHNMSDLIGSNSAVGKGNRGSGLPIPMTQFFQLFDRTRLGSGDDIAKIAREVFESGYDVRHGAALAVPVVLNNLIIHFMWTIKQYFYHKKTLNEVKSQKNSPELRRMLLMGHGCLCLVDGGDAVIQGGGNIMLIFSRMNFVAWSKFAYAGFKEVRVIYGQNVLNIEALDKDLESEWNEILSDSIKY
ncbi:hypothetical protein JZO70_17180 [Enterococcus sp. 669A]|uniref:LXG domain-containing protein n=1 Tax=Candidatus Enterococcus moelleringii TaxID=2815325 RepID=A0ABS3LE54_9ENTE|nr:hypothetical protein [Enterococcus sp. 669A]MBO1307911.1 hypothetical protein [Enterococcus sp. 669A]